MFLVVEAEPILPNYIDICDDMWVAEVHPCDTQCVAGCSGPFPSNCRACANYVEPGGVCVAQCKPGTYAREEGDLAMCLPCEIEACLACAAGPAYVVKTLKHLMHYSSSFV
ncbi:hypothetical protein E6Q11_05985 [Candidatus Dojkabacteria bacterium]|uniref:Furin-like cysteine-rich domain-containing protein n=1 Tax=Candidatus Dojkabacteria bacterium TaxID=2099670 RepID=A0A5C7J340_9BACT|nr:MAG: hypothetical protein E6Q11_05985 [Candidatus Dojkabacteria bacterium]